MKPKLSNALHTDKWNCLQIKVSSNDDASGLNLTELMQQAKTDGNKAAWLHVDAHPELIPTQKLYKEEACRASRVPV